MEQISCTSIRLLLEPGHQSPPLPTAQVSSISSPIMSSVLCYECPYIGEGHQSAALLAGEIRGAYKESLMNIPGHPLSSFRVEPHVVKNPSTELCVNW